MKVLAIILSILVLASFMYAGDPKVEWHGLFYIYNFGHRNTDFTSSTDDGNSYMYMHGDVNASVDFGNGVTAYMVLGAWGQHGMSPYHGGGLGENIDPRVDIMQAYFTISHLWGSNFSFRVGKERLLYGDGAIMFDGGEDGAAGAKLMYNSDVVDVDLFYYRYAQMGGIMNVGTGLDVYPGNWNLIGIYPTVKLMQGNLKLYPYYVARHVRVAKDTLNMPMWFGLRLEGTFLGGLNVAAEYTQMGGKDQTTDLNYKGHHMLLRADYTLPSSPLTFGLGYVLFSGDKKDTEKDNELYETATQGPYTYGFYKDWPGFGPAHLMTTGWGFAGVNPWSPTMSNMNMMDVNVAYNFGDLAVRGDFFMYNKDQTSDGNNKSMGNEIALMVKYNYKQTITLGLTGGIWMPGDWQKSWIEVAGSDAKAESALGGYFWLAKAF